MPFRGHLFLRGGTTNSAYGVANSHGMLLRFLSMPLQRKAPLRSWRRPRHDVRDASSLRDGSPCRFTVFGNGTPVRCGCPLPVKNARRGRERPALRQRRALPPKKPCRLKSSPCPSCGWSAAAAAAARDEYRKYGATRVRDSGHSFRERGRHR